MRRDFVFFLRNIPQELHTFGPNYFLSRIEPDLAALIISVGEPTGFTKWLANRPFSMAVIRSDVEDLDNGIDLAYNSMSGICDVYTLLGEDEKPKISPLVLIREGNHPTATAYMIIQPSAHMRANSSDGAAEARWQERNLKLTERFLPLFRACAQLEANLTGELFGQVRLAAKMFRHGARSRSFGVEFLCKMSALEGLVCGWSREKKQHLLQQRITDLFKGATDWKKLVYHLYELRSRASHQSLAFSHEFVQAITDADFLITGTMAFFADHLEKAQRIDDLWSLAPAYHLPPEATQQHEVFRGRITLAKMKTDNWIALGAVMDSTFEEYRKKYGEA